MALPGLRIIKNAVPLAEGASAHVLAAEAHSVPFRQQRSKSQRLGVGPVDALSGGDGLLAGSEEAFRNGGVEVEPLWNFEQAFAHLLELRELHAGVHGNVVVSSLRFCHAALERISAVGHLVPVSQRIDAVFQLLFKLTLQSRCARFVQNTLRREVQAEKRSRGWMLGDRPRHVRLRKSRLVRLIMPVASVTDDVDDHITAKGLPEIERQLRGVDHLHRAITVHMNDGGLDHFGHVRAVVRTPRILGLRCEADLVVRDDVNRAASLIAGQLREVQDLSHQSLTSESRITMQKQGNDLLAVLCVPKRTLTRTCHALDHRIHGFQMAWIRCQHDAHLVPAAGFPGRLKAKVVLHVTVTCHHIGHVVLAEFVKQIIQRFPQEIGQNAESSAVRHPHDDLLAAAGWQTLKNRLQSDQHRLGTLNGKALLADEPAVQETLERFRLQQPAQGVDLLCGGWFRIQITSFDALQPPVPHLRIVDVHEFESGLPAESAAQLGQHRFQLHRTATAKQMRLHLLVELIFGETESGSRQRWDLGPSGA